MNQYPLWKYLLILALAIVGAVYALPNIYGEDPAIQIAATRVKVDTATLVRVEETLRKAGIGYLVFGAELGGRARFAFLPPLSAELGAGVAYFGRSVRFTAADRDETELVRVGPLTFGARLGLDVVFD